MDHSSIWLAPTREVHNRGDKFKKSKSTNRNEPAIAQPRGQRGVQVPLKTPEFEYGDAFPERNVIQYSLRMHQNGKECHCNALSVQPNAEGKDKYKVIARQGHAKDKSLNLRSKDLLAEVIAKGYPRIQTPFQEEIDEVTKNTRTALQKLMDSDISAPIPVRWAKMQVSPQLVGNKSSQPEADSNLKAKRQIIRAFKDHVDCVKRSKLQGNSKIPSSSPGPVFCSPTRRPAVWGQNESKIPSCISHSKNLRGCTVPSDKRSPTEGSELQQVYIIDEIDQIAEVFHVADDALRKAEKTRSRLKQKLAQKLKERKEQLRQIAHKAYTKRAYIRRHQRAADNCVINEEVSERQKLLQNLQNQRTRKRHFAGVAANNPNILQNERGRDISELTDLGMPTRVASSNEIQFDEKLLELAQALGQQHADKPHKVYEPRRDNVSMEHSFCRTSGNISKDIYAEIPNMFALDTEISGTDRSGIDRSESVPFEKCDLIDLILWKPD